MAHDHLNRLGFAPVSINSEAKARRHSRRVNKVGRNGARPSPRLTAQALPLAVGELSRPLIGLEVSRNFAEARPG